MVTVGLRQADDPTNDTRDIIRVAIESLNRIWKEGHRYMKAGVMLSDFFSQGVRSLACSMNTHRGQTVQP